MNIGRDIHNIKQYLLKELLSEIEDIVYPYDTSPDYDAGIEYGLDACIEIIKNKIDGGMEE
jgi:hypothetical protein